MTQLSAHALESPNMAAPAGRAPWLRFFLVNGSLPLAILAVYFIGLYVESRHFPPYYTRILMLIGFNVILAVGLQMINGFSGQFSLGHAGFMAVGAYLAAYPAKQYSDRLSDPGATLVFYLSLFIAVGILGGAFYGLFTAIRATRRIHTSIPALLLLVVLGWIVTDVTVRQRGSTSPFLVWSWVFELVQRMFLGMVGALHSPATSASGLLPEAFRAPTTFIILLVGAGCCAGAVGFVVGLPTLRLRGDYLAIATLGLSEIIRIVIQNSPPLGGALGLTNIPRYTNFAWLWGVAIVSIVLVWRLAYSARGRQIIATREDEIAASAVGIGTTRQKVLSFVVGAFLGGVAGALFAMQERSITPGYFNIQKSIELVVIVTLGGLGSISGAILAAVVLTILPEVLRTAPSAWPWGVVIVLVGAAIGFAVQNRELIIAIVKGWLGRGRAAGTGPPAHHTVSYNIYPVLFAFGVLVLWELMRWTGRRYGFAMSEFRMIIYSLLLVIMMLVRPQGLLGGRELWPRRKLAPLRLRGVSVQREPPPTVDKPATQDAAGPREQSW